ncbi:uncharacterized protein LOC131675557 [Phymastichus coffea]|uniref:uncharacterized protein LOC131675557 n=1 Tax=Phymastichus coffea TaxID=108790 RepID=UPI00273C20B0|nr:uncharacterized protein LOC131675557 [Phymastichus coffea]
MKLLPLLLLAPLVCLLVAVQSRPDEGYWLRFTAPSLKSEIFGPLRANEKRRIAVRCGERVSESYGVLEQTFGLHSAAASLTNCTWYLRAPADHVVNVISISFVLQDETKPPLSDDIRVSTISLYDDTEPNPTNLLTTYYVSPREKVGHFANSLSSKQDMVVEIKYHANKDFETQTMMVEYEFLDVDKMNALLRAD